MGHPSAIYLTLFPGDRQRLDPKRMRLELGVKIRHVEPGEYHGHIVIRSTDPLVKECRVPLHIIVGAPQLRITFDESRFLPFFACSPSKKTEIRRTTTMRA